MKKAISAQGTKMYLENPNAAPVATGRLTAGSQSAPCYVTFEDVGKLKNGVPLYVSGTGWLSLDDQEWVLQDLDTVAKTGALYGSDTSNETAIWSQSNAAYVLNAFADVCAQSYAINQNPATSIDTTTLCDAEKTSLVGFRDPGTLTFDFFIDPTDPDYLALLEAYKDGEERMFELIYSNGAVRTLPVIVQSVNETGGVDQAVHGSATMKITGSPILTLPASAIAPSYGVQAVLTPSAGGAAPLTTTLTMTETNGVATKFTINWNDGGADETLTAATVVTHDYATAGDHYASVVATVAGLSKPSVDSNHVTVT